MTGLRAANITEGFRVQSPMLLKLLLTGEASFAAKGCCGSLLNGLRPPRNAGHACLPWSPIPFRAWPRNDG